MAAADRGALRQICWTNFHPPKHLVFRYICITTVNSIEPIRLILHGCSVHQQGLVALVTGASEGLGKAVADKFLKQGAQLILIDRKDTQCPSPFENKNDVLYLPTDITCEEEVKFVFEQTQEKYGHLNIVVNTMDMMKAMGMFTSKMKHYNSAMGQLLEMSYKYNTLSTFNICRHAAQLMGKNDRDHHGQRGCIINTSQQAAEDGMSGQLTYATTKAAVNAMTLPLARDLASEGIRVNTIQIGFMAINVHQQMDRNLQNFFASLMLMKNNNEFGNPKEYAQICQAVIDNPLVNGEIIRLDAGFRSLYLYPD